jgi:hypothetical protein
MGSVVRGVPAMLEAVAVMDPSRRAGFYDGIFFSAAMFFVLSIVMTSLRLL